MTDPNDSAQWQRMRFKRNKVWLAVDDNQRPLMDNGKVLIKYQLDQSHQYWVHPSSVRPLDDTEPDQPDVVLGAPVPGTQTAAANRPCSLEADGAINIYTDGACSGNPGPAGIGVVMKYRDRRKEISRHIGTATNNVAELEAIRQGLGAVKNRQLPVCVFTDSAYAMGVLIQGWKTRRNKALVAKIQELLSRFGQVRFIKVKGHAGHPENERADNLAVEALRKDKTP